MTRNLKGIAWTLMVLACGRLGVSMFTAPSVVSPGFFLLLMAPYVILGAAVALIREERLARWAVGVAFGLCVVTYVADYYSDREFWSHLGLWINFISECQLVIALVFLFETSRQFLKQR